MPQPRLLILPLLATLAACSAPAPRDAAPLAEPSQAVAPAPAAQPSPQRLVTAMAERCRATVAGHDNAVVMGEPRAALMRDDWIQVDGTMEWRGPAGTLRNRWTCDMFRGEDGEWRRRYLSFGPG